jgi:hypothetical protein
MRRGVLSLTEVKKMKEERMASVPEKDTVFVNGTFYDYHRVHESRC